MSADARASDSIAARARSSAASTAAGETRCAAASASRSFALSSARSTGSSTRRQYRVDRMETSELDYDLPQELIAQQPAERRDASRLLVYDRGSGEVPHRVLGDLADELRGELVIVNDTRVLPARLPLERPRGEVLLLEPIGDGVWEG